jgi:gliotoxin/aspirochlorine biosynthesis gamma-glutamylcyclotransferase
LKTIQAIAPGYVLCFDLPGIPYQEPAFSSIRRRQSETDPDVIGIAYLLTRSEYERLLLTEGGRGGGYLEIDIEVKPLLDLTDEKSTISCISLSTRVPREHPHPLPSARYLSLIQTGAAEHQFPARYQNYLDHLAIYTVTSWKTEVGRILFLLIWLPVVVFLYATAAQSGKDGSPDWLKRLKIWTFLAMWKMHDDVFSPIFGPGDTCPEKQDTVEGYLKC